MPGDTGDNSLTAMFWNIRAGGGPKRAPAITLAILDAAPDMVCLCECRPTFAGQISAALRDQGLRHTVHSATTPRQNGMLFASREPFTQHATEDPKLLTIQLRDLHITAAHIPDASTPSPRKLAWHRLHETARRHRDCHHLILGDMNADRRAAPARDGVPLGRLAALGYVDLISMQQPSAPPATWVGPRGQSARLDYAFASTPLVSCIQSASTEPAALNAGLSDHAPLQVRIRSLDL